MEAGRRIYFLSDFHLGIPDHARSLERERRITTFLELAARDAAEMHVLGDMFDMWFEWGKTVPRGYVRLLGKLADLNDRGIPLHLYVGNHDMWIFDYVPLETGMVLHREEVAREWGGKKFLIGHGDGLGPGDHGYKFIKRVFRNPVCQWLFARLHPNLAMSIAEFWSGRSRLKSYENDRKWLGEDNEWLVQHCRAMLRAEHRDFFIYGHRHLPIDIPVGEESRYVNLGDWITHFTYAVFDGNELRLMKRAADDGPLAADMRISGGPAV
jgi:UDP-2,3-diacylglucosamine hydrolase